jgi:hypothetical protein
MAKISKPKPIYEGVEKIGEGKGKNDILVDTDFIILSYARLEGNTEKGEKDFAVAKILTNDDKETTTTFSNIILRTLEETAKQVGVTPDPEDERIQVFQEPLDVTLKKIQSAENKGREYYTLENQE